MKRTPRAAALALPLLFVALFGCADSASPPAAERVEAPPGMDFQLASLDGGNLGPADFADQVVLVEFWATWCTPCHKQADILREIHAEFGDRDVAFLAVSVGEPSDVVSSFVEKKPFPYPVLLDTEEKVSGELGVYLLPTVLVLDRARSIVYFSPGVASAETVRSALTEAGA